MRNWRHPKALFLEIYPPVLTLMVVLGALEWFVRKGLIHDYIFPAPSEVVRACITEFAALKDGALSTTLSAAAGLLLSSVVGTLLAVFFSVSSFIRKAVYPYAVFFQTVPIIAIAPILVIWFGFGQSTVIASSFIVSIFPVIANVLLGLQSTDPQLEELFRLYGASKWDRFLKLKIPFALPQIFAGLRIASGLAIVGAIVGEFVAGGGLGGVVDVARTQQRLDLVFASVLISSALGLVFVAVIHGMSWVMLRRWHPSEVR
jgi:NitT/TauT family transport system permease protein